MDERSQERTLQNAKIPSPVERRRVLDDGHEPDSARGGGSAARDLDALARVLPVLDGSAMPLIRIPGGQQDGSPAERVQPLLGPALRGLRRLAWLREHGRYEHVLVLLATYCYAGETRRDRAWPDTVRLALLPRELRVRTMAAPPVTAPSKGPDAASARTAGGQLLAEAEDAYTEADELGSDGRWLAEDLDEVSRLIEAVEADQRAVAAARRKGPAPARAPSVCVVGAEIDLDPCPSRETGLRVNLRGTDARCGGRVVGVRCARRKRDRWMLRDAALVLSPLAGTRPWRSGRRRGAGGAMGALRSGSACGACGLLVPEGERHRCSVAARAAERARAQRRAEQAHRAAIRALRVFGAVLAEAAKAVAR